MLLAKRIALKTVTQTALLTVTQNCTITAAAEISAGMEMRY
jgi:hypothetical protein